MNKKKGMRKILLVNQQYKSAWPKIGSKDSFELTVPVDFLRSFEASIVHIKALEILND